MKVKEMMHKGVEWVSPDTPVATLAKKMLQFDVGALPIGKQFGDVRRGQHPIGHAAHVT